MMQCSVVPPHECDAEGCDHDSGCAVHNGPALPVGACDCGAAPSLSFTLDAARYWYLTTNLGTFET